MRSERSPAGQASVEYVAVCALVAAVLGAATALTSGGIGSQVAYGMRRGLCAVTGTACPPPRPTTDLPPCPLHRDARGEEYRVSLAFVHVGGGLTVLQERDSAGRVEVTFADSGRAGLVAGVGAHFNLDGLDAGAALTGDVGVGFTAGRSWRFPSQGAADHFVARYGSDQTLLGRFGNDVRRSCGVCQLVGWEPDRPPTADETFVEGGGHMEARVVAGLGARAEAGVALADALGRRRSRSGATTWYMRLDGSAAARLFAGVGVGGTAGASGLVEYTADGAGRPRELRVRLAGRSAEETAVPRAELVPGSPPQVRVPVPPFRGRGSLVESDTSLDLSDPVNRAVALDFLGTIAPLGVASLAGRLSALLDRIRTHGVSDLRSFRLRGAHRGVEGTVGAGPVLGAGLARDSQRLDLTGVYTRLPGLGFMPRADCLAA